MRIDIDHLPAFSGLGSGSIVATVDLSSAEYTMIGVSITALTGAPTGVRIEGNVTDTITHTNIFNGGDVIGSADVGVTTPIAAMISRIGSASNLKTTILAEGFLLPPPLKYLSISIFLVGGTTPTVSGSVYLFKYTR